MEWGWSLCSLECLFISWEFTGKTSQNAYITSSVRRLDEQFIFTIGTVKKKKRMHIKIFIHPHSVPNLFFFFFFLRGKQNEILCRMFMLLFSIQLQKYKWQINIIRYLSPFDSCTVYLSNHMIKSFQNIGNFLSIFFKY